MFLLGKEMGWSKRDLYEFRGHEIISQLKRLKDWNKTHSQACPLLSYNSKG